MYKLLLCWRYLRTRYIALVSIISVTLGVATMIVVNSVMQGFTSEMQNRIHGILSDVVIETYSLEGMPYTPALVARIRKAAGDDIEALTPTVVVPAMLDYQYGGMPVVRPVQLIGIDEKTQGSVSDFRQVFAAPGEPPVDEFRLARERLRRPRPPGRRRRPRSESRWVRPAGNTAAGRRSSAPPRSRTRPPSDYLEMWHSRPRLCKVAQDSRGRLCHNRRSPPMTDPFAPYAKNLGEPEGTRFDPAKQQYTGIVLGIALVSSRTPAGEDRFRVIPGDDVKLTFPTTARPPTAVSDNFTIVDFYESKMSEYDSTFVFVPIAQVAGAARHDRPDHRRGQRQRHPNQTQAGRQRRGRARPAAGGLPPDSPASSTPGATSKAPCWPPCIWKPRSSTCFCS